MPLTFAETLFGLKGRIARLPYLGYSILAFITACALMMAAVGISRPFDGVGAGLSLLVIVVAMLGLLWVNLALSVKRLHDMGYSGLHLIWIYLIQYGTGSIGAVDHTAGVVASLVSIGLGLWMLCAPGDVEDNRFGPHPIRPLSFYDTDIKP